MTEETNMVTITLNAFRDLQELLGTAKRDLAFAERLSDCFFWMRDTATEPEVQEILTGLDRHVAWVETAANELTYETFEPLFECLENHYPDIESADWIIETSEALDHHLSTDFRTWRRHLHFAVERPPASTTDAGSSVRVRLEWH